MARVAAEKDKWQNCTGWVYFYKSKFQKSDTPDSLQPCHIHPFSVPLQKFTPTAVTPPPTSTHKKKRNRVVCKERNCPKGKHVDRELSPSKPHLLASCNTGRVTCVLSTPIVWRENLLLCPVLSDVLPVGTATCCRRYPLAY